MKASFETNAPLFSAVSRTQIFWDKRKNILVLYEAYTLYKGKEKLLLLSITPLSFSYRGPLPRTRGWHWNWMCLFHLPHRLLVLTHGEVYPCRWRTSPHRPFRLTYQKIVWFTFMKDHKCATFIQSSLLRRFISEKSKNSRKQKSILLLVGPKFNNDIF